LKRINIDFNWLSNKKRNLKITIALLKFILLIIGLYIISFLFWLLLQIFFANKVDTNINTPNNQNADQFIVNNIPFGTYKIIESTVAVAQVNFADKIQVTGVFADSNGKGFAIFTIDGKQSFADVGESVTTGVFLVKISAQSVVVQSASGESKEIYLQMIDANGKTVTNPNEQSTNSSGNIMMPVATTSSTVTMPQPVSSDNTAAANTAIIANNPVVINTPTTPTDANNQNIDYSKPENRQKYIEQLKNSVQ